MSHGGPVPPLRAAQALSDTSRVHQSLRALPLIALVSLTLALAACGADEEPSQPAGEPATEESDSGGEAETTDEAEAPAPDPDATEVEVIERWSEALTEGDIDTAAEYFAIPSVAENGLRVDIESVEDARFFNESLPCGAVLEGTETQGEFITATFRLQERPGVPACTGEGNTAQTSFVIEDGLIAEWRRVAVPGQEAPGQTT